MIKWKGVATVMGIMIIPVIGWAVIVSLVIKPNIWVGSALSLGVGTVIGGTVAFLMRRWWFKGILPKEVNTNGNRSLE